MKNSWYVLDCATNEKLIISFVLRQQKSVTKFDKFTFVATDFMQTQLSTGILAIKFKHIHQ